MKKLFYILIVLISLFQTTILAALILTNFSSRFALGLAISGKFSWDILLGVFFTLASLYNLRMKQKILLIFSLAGLLSYITLRLWFILT